MEEQSGGADVKTVVCMKQIPAASGQNGHSAARYLTNPFDLCAMEAALELRALAGGAVVPLTLGGGDGGEGSQRKAAMMGADEGVHVLCNELGEVSDSFIRASILAYAARAIGFDLLALGARSIDGAGEVIGALVAELLGLPLITRSMNLRLEPGTGRLLADKKLERGLRETYAVKLPAVVTVDRGLEPRYSGPGWVHRLLKKSQPRMLTLSEIGFNVQQSTARVTHLGVIPPRPRTKVGVKVSGLSLQDKLKIMRGGNRGSSGEKAQVRTTGDPAETVLQHLKKWLD